MAKPERGQIPFIFERRKDPDQFYYASGFAQQENPDRAGRFVRKLREEIQVRTPADAAEHLLGNVFAPFEAFDQEELWCLLVDTKNRITHEAMIYRGVRRITASNYRIGTILWEGADNPQAQPT